MAGMIVVKSPFKTIHGVNTSNLLRLDFLNPRRAVTASFNIHTLVLHAR